MPYRAMHQDSRHPFEIILVAWMLIYSVPSLVFESFPGRIEDGTPDWFRWTWSGILMVFSIVTAMGIYWKQDSNGLVTEAIGLMWCGVALMAYGGAILISGTEGGVFSGGLVFLFGVGCWWRVRQIQQGFRAVRRGEYVVIRRVLDDE